MRRRKKRKKRTFFTVFSSRLFLFVLILVLAWVGKSTIDKFMSWSQAKDALISEETKIQEEEEKNKSLKETLEYLQSEDYLEKTVKEKLNLAKPGEKIIYVLPEEDENSGESLKNEGFWEKLKEIFTK